MAALASILLLLAVAAARAAPPTTAANRLAARRDAGRLLGRVLLPAGARPLASPPPALRSPFQRAGTPAVVDERALWQAPQPLAQVLAFERAHRPRGSRLVLEGTGTDASGRSISGLGFAWPALPGRLSSRILLVAATSRPDGSTALRVDAQVVWVVARSPREAVPAGARQVDLREGRRPPVRFTAPAEVARIVRWLDELPVVQPGGYACPDLVSGPRPRRARRRRRAARSRPLRPVRARSQPRLDAVQPARLRHPRPARAAARRRPLPPAARAPARK